MLPETSVGGPVELRSDPSSHRASASVCQTLQCHTNTGEENPPHSEFTTDFICCKGAKDSLHALRGLAGDVDQLEHLELGLLHVQVFVEAAALTPLCDNGQVVLGHVAHEEQDVHVPGLPARGAPREISGCTKNASQGCLTCTPG